MSCTREYTTIKIINIYIGIVTIIFFFLESRVKMRTPSAPHNRIKIVIDNSVSTIYNNSVQCRTYITLYLYYLHEFTTVIFYFRKITVVYNIRLLYPFTVVHYGISLLQYDLGNARMYICSWGIPAHCSVSIHRADITIYYTNMIHFLRSSIVKCKRNVFDGFSVCYGITFNTYQYYYNIQHNIIIYEQQ